MELKSIRKPLTDKQKIQLLRLCLKSVRKTGKMVASVGVATDFFPAIEMIDSVLDYDCKYFPEVAGVANNE